MWFFRKKESMRNNFLFVIEINLIEIVDEFKWEFHQLRNFCSYSKRISSRTLIIIYSLLQYTNTTQITFIIQKSLTDLLNTLIWKTEKKKENMFVHWMNFIHNGKLYKYYKKNSLSTHAVIFYNTKELPPNKIFITIPGDAISYFDEIYH